jgi:hypothetical protein
MKLHNSTTTEAARFKLNRRKTKTSRFVFRAHCLKSPKESKTDDVPQASSTKPVENWFLFERAHWVRYQMIDLKRSWDQIVFGFPVQFHQDAPRRANLQDDFHKNNDIVALDEDGNAVFDLNGRQEWIRMDQTCQRP